LQCWAFGNPRANRNLSSRIGALQAAGNAIVIPLAAEFIRTVMDVLRMKSGGLDT
jgi:hypothetical protein